MGIRSLNKFIKEKHGSIIQRRFMEDYSNESLAIDISIYMYKCKLTDNFYEKLYDMCALFTKNNINAIFVFDGNATNEKKEELKRRKETKQRAKDAYKLLENKYTQELNEDEKEEIEQKMTALKKQFIRITSGEREFAKELITYFGLSYIQAPREADEMCAYLCNSGKCYACISDDTDMFAYGCKRVLRQFNMTTGTCLEYNCEDLCNSLNVNMGLFKQLCVLSGTDYHTGYDVNRISFYRSTKELFIFYKTNNECIYDYFYNNNDTIENLKHIESLFKYDSTILGDQVECVKGVKNVNKMQHLLKEHNFYFVSNQNKHATLKL